MPDGATPAATSWFDRGCPALRPDSPVPLVRRRAWLRLPQNKRSRRTPCAACSPTSPRRMTREPDALAPHRRARHVDPPRGGLLGGAGRDRRERGSELAKFLTVLDGEVLAHHGHVRNFSSLLRRACLLHLSRAAGRAAARGGPGRPSWWRRNDGGGGLGDGRALPPSQPARSPRAAPAAPRGAGVSPSWRAPPACPCRALRECPCRAPRWWGRHRSRPAGAWGCPTGCGGSR